MKNIFLYILVISLSSISFAENVTTPTLQLNGTGIVKRQIFFSVYKVSLYLPQLNINAEKILLSDEPRRIKMEIVFSFHEISDVQLMDEWYRGLKDNTPNYSKELKTQFDLLASWTEPTNKGDILLFNYLPDKGTEVIIKGIQKGIIPGKHFADALLRMWIGEHPIGGDKVKTRLLGK